MLEQREGVAMERCMFVKPTSEETSELSVGLKSDKV